MFEKEAEEYVMREDITTENDKVPFDNGYGFQTVDFEKEVKKGYKQAFLAGLKAGRPQCHDLRKNPNDLPKRDKTFVTDVSVTVIVYPLGFAMYYFFDKNGIQTERK